MIEKACMRCSSKEKLYMLTEIFPLYEVCYTCAMQYHHDHKGFVKDFMDEKKILEGKDEFVD